MSNRDRLTRRVRRLEERQQQDCLPILLRQISDDADQWKMVGSTDPLRGKVFTLEEVGKIAAKRGLSSFVLAYHNGGLAVAHLQSADM